MSWTAPTPAELKAAFPAFAAVPDDTINYWLTRAARTVDASWPDEDGPHAQMLLTAHLLTQQGQGTGAEAEGFGAGASGFKRIKSGALEIERFEPGSSDLQTTSYGIQFAALLASIKGGSRVTSTGALPDCGYGFGCGRIPGW